MVVSCPAELVHDVVKVPASVISIFTDSAIEKQVKNNYDKYGTSIDITNFIRRGDPVANYATSVGTPKYIDNDSSISSSLNLSFEFHSITNFRYQGFNGESMSLTSCNKNNIEILKTHKGVYTKEKFNAVFTELLHEKI